MIRYFRLLLFFGLLLVSCRPVFHKDQVIYINGGSVRAGILPAVGGTVVYLSRGQSGNLLYSDSTCWNIPDSMRAPVSPYMQIPPVLGHTVWVGPQAGWWLQQNADTVLKKNSAEWPPDPYLSVAPYLVNERSEELVGMLGPASPYTGLQFEKQYKAEPGGKVICQVLAKNTRESIVSWDLWFSTFVDQNSRCYVPVQDTSVVHVVQGSDSVTTGVPYRVIDKFFTFTPDSILPGIRQRAKAYIYPKYPYIAVFIRRNLLIIRFPQYPIETIHPAQNLVEISASLSSDSNQGWLQLQHHTPYKVLKPGEMMSSWETWEILDYDGGSSIDDQTAFLRKTGL